MKNFNFMAFGKVKESTDAATFKAYTGYDNCYLAGVNPTMQERNDLLNANSEKAPEYTGVDDNGKKTATVAMYLRPESLKEENVVIPAFFFLTEDYRWNKDHTKVQVIDKYGYSGWATEEQVKTHAPLLSSNGNNLRITTEYRPAYQGEIALVEFIKNFLNIDELLVYKNNVWTVDSSLNKADCECYLDTAKLFKGDFSEVKSIVTFAPNNRVKVVMGVRTTSEGNVRQAVYTQKTLRSSSATANNIFKEIMERKSNGGLSTTEFDNAPIHVYEVKATTFVPKEENAATTVDPFATPTTLEF